MFIPLTDYGQTSDDEALNKILSELDDFNDDNPICQSYKLVYKPNYCILETTRDNKTIFKTTLCGILITYDNEHNIYLRCDGKNCIWEGGKAISGRDICFITPYAAKKGYELLVKLQNHCNTSPACPN